MPLPFPTNLWTRAQWQAARADTSKNGVAVPKGAARVSIGDGLDKFHAANKKGVREGIKAAQALKKDIGVYKDAVKKKYPKWYTRVEKQVEYEIDHYLADTAKLPGYVSSYTAKRNKAAEVMMQLGAEFIQWEKAGSHGTFKASNEKAAIKALTEFLDVVKKMPFATDKITAADAKVFDRTVYAASGGAWNKNTVDSLIKQVSGFPGSV